MYTYRNTKIKTNLLQAYAPGHTKKDLVTHLQIYITLQSVICLQKDFLPFFSNKSQLIT